MNKQQQFALHTYRIYNLTRFCIRCGLYSGKIYAMMIRKGKKKQNPKREKKNKCGKMCELFRFQNEMNDEC